MFSELTRKFDTVPRNQKKNPKKFREFPRKLSELSRKFREFSGKFSVLFSKFNILAWTPTNFPGSSTRYPRSSANFVGSLSNFQANVTKIGKPHRLLSMKLRQFLKTFITVPKNVWPYSANQSVLIRTRDYVFSDVLMRMGIIFIFKPNKSAYECVFDSDW